MASRPGRAAASRRTVPAGPALRCRHAWVLALLLAAPLAARGDVTCSGANASLNLGTYTGFSDTPVDASGAIVITCSRNGGPRTTTATVGIGPSLHSGSIVVRQVRLTTGSDLLSYNLYRDAARLSVWGQTAGIDTMSQSLDLSNKTSGTLTFPVYTRLPAQQDVRAGYYSDQLVVTVEY